MGLGKTYSTRYLADSNNNTGAVGQVLISTATGINWSNGSDIIGGPYLKNTTDTFTGELTLYQSSTVAPTLLTLSTYSGDTSNDGTMGSFIDFEKTDDNATFLPQARIGMVVKDSDGDGGIASEGCGNLVFYTSEGTDATGGGVSSEKLRITDKGNVGIGTISPSAKLEVDVGVNSLKISGRDTYIDSSIDSANANIYVTQAGVGDFGQLAGSLVLQARTQGTIYRDIIFAGGLTSGDALMTILGQGEVGIGTDGPLGKLMVRDDTAGAPTRLIVSNGGTVESGTSARLSFYEGTSEKGYIERRRDSSGKIAFVTPADDNPFVWENPTGEIMRINNSNVGIGNSDTSGARLKVLGKVVFDGHNSNDPDSTSRTAYPADQMFTHYDNNGVSIIGGEGSYTGVGLTIGEETGRSVAFKFIRGVSDTNGGANAAEEFWVDGAGNSYFAGNVGIGDITPTAKLDILKNDDTVYDPSADDGQRSIGPTIQLNNNSTVTNTFGQIMYDTDSSGQAVARMVFLDAGNASSAIAFVTENAEQKGERMRIAPSGKVGIGTNNPQDALDVDWDTEGVATDNSGIRVRAYRPHLNLIDRSGYTTSNGHNFQIKADGAKLQFNATSADDETFDLTRMVIDKDGQVGIGTITPGAKLEIEGDATGDDTAQLIIASGGVDNNSIIHFTDDEGGQVNAIGSLEGNILTLASQNELVFKTGTGSILGNTDTRMTITTSGSVGIGKIDPDDILEVYGSSPNIRVTNTAETDAGIVFNDAQAGTAQMAAIKFNSSDQKLKFFVNDEVAQRMVIDTVGNVGIGLVAPVGKLDVFRTDTNYAVNLSDTLNRAGLIVKASGSFDSKITFSSGAASRQYIQATNNAATTGRDICINPYGGALGIGTTSPNTKLDLISGTNNGIRISATDTTSNWRDINIRSYVSQSEADALPEGIAIFTTNPSGQSDPAFSKYGGTVIQCRDDGNSSFAIRVGSGLTTAFFINNTAAATFSSTVTATNFILSSDKRLKDNIKKIDTKHIDVNWKNFELKSEPGVKRSGVIAQELEEKHPEFVRTNDQGMKSVAYIDLLIAKIAELEARLEKAGI